MEITFYILIPNKRKLRFGSAAALDAYIKAHKLPAKSIIQLKHDDKIIGEMSPKRYLELEQA